MNESYLGPAEPCERLESLVPIAAELLRRDGRHFTMAQLRRPDGVWELVDVDRAGGWGSVADLVREIGCDAVIVVAEARARRASPPQHGPGDEVLLFALAEAPDHVLVRVLPFRREEGRIVTHDGPQEGEALLGAAFLEPVLSVWRGRG
jgi:hypothetical protein